MYGPKKMYEFAFERKTLRRIIAGLAVLNFLVFAAGFFTGVTITFPQWIANQPPAATKPAEVQTGFYMPPDPTPAAQPAVEQKVETPAVAEEDLPAEEVATLAETEIDPDAPALDFPRTPYSVPAELIDSSKFAVQVGAFLSSANAEVLITQLKDRGYTAYIFLAPDMKGRTWHLVRIGGFIDRGTATTAATDFRAKERMTALVRPANAM
jgi:cell division septation protein DedD